MGLSPASEDSIKSVTLTRITIIYSEIYGNIFGNKNILKYINLIFIKTNSRW
jgi:hypothetical protein